MKKEVEKDKKGKFNKLVKYLYIKEISKKKADRLYNIGFGNELMKGIK